ncbi:MAG: ABC transporter substrate-binding protein [Thaumarchaeota archaeon]|nr:ABC transporter substrate-binding protein [Nitrososphaerota archaeon]
MSLIPMKRKLVGVLLILPVLMLSSLVAVPAARGQTSIPSTPSLNKITLTDYGGNDQSGIADLAAGKIQSYDYAVTPSEASTIPSGYNDYKTPASWYGLEINPTDTTGGFNPFQFQQVRFALNYLVGRSYFVGTLLGGNGIPTYSVFGGEPDELVTAAATAPDSNITDSIPIANATIYKALIAEGATYTSTSTPRWSHDGKPIIVSIFDRTDDPVRHAYDGYLQAQLQAVGFEVNLIPGTLATASIAVYGTDPVNATWEIYPASYGFTYGYYDEGFAELYAPIAGALPASSNEGPAFGAFNDTSSEQPGTVALLNTADTYALDFFNTNFSSIQQRDSDLSSLVSAGVKAAVVIGLAQSLEPYVSAPSLQGVTTNFVNDPLLNALSFLTMNTASGTADIGVRHIAQTSLNPVGGYTDTYSVVWSEATQFPPVFYQPSTGYPYPVGWSFSVQGLSAAGEIPIPSSAVVLNATQDKFVNVTAGAMAKSDVIANFAPMLKMSWQDGQPLTLADILYQYILAGEVTQNTNSSVFDGYSSAVFGPSWNTLLGFRVINSTSLEVYSTFYYPDKYFAGLNAAGALFAYTPTTGAQGMFPWQIYAGMANLVSAGKDVWSASASTTTNLPWLSLVNPTDVSNLKAALSSYASSSYVPPEFASLQKLTGTSFVSSSQAAAGYNAAVSFIGQYGTGIIGDGPYILTDYSPSTSPAFAVLTKNPNFTWGNTMAPQLGAAPVLLSQEAQIPPVLSPGQSITVTALQTPEGTTTTTPASGATVTLQLIGNGVVAYQANFTTNLAGQVSVKIPSTLAPGSYILSIYTGTEGSTLFSPLTETIQLSAATSTTSSTSTTLSTSASTSPSGGTTTTTTSTQPTTTTSSSGSSTSLSPTVLGGVALVSIVVMAMLVLGVNRRRGNMARSYPRPISKQANN